MKVPKKSLILAAAFVFTGVASAQTTGQDGKTSFRRYTKPMPTVNLDLETGVITRGPVVNDQAGAGTIASFPNLDLGGFVAVDTGLSFCEWIDAGTKPAARLGGGGSQFLNGFSFAYCSSALDTSMGGPGGTSQVFFREGYLSGGGAQGTEIARFTLTGLPANTSSSSFFGGFRCFFLNITIATPFCFLDGPIGYGWRFVDVGTDGTLAATFTFLSCVSSCSGPGPDDLGMIDFIDQYCPPNSLLSTFSFGTNSLGGYFTSMSMELREDAPCNFPSNAVPDSAINTGVLSNDFLAATGTAGLSPRLGTGSEPFEYSLNCDPAAGNQCTNNKVEVRLLTTMTTFTDGGGTSVELLCAKPKLIKFGSGGDLNGIAIPLNNICDASFFGIPYCYQGFCFGCPGGAFPPTAVVLSNAYAETVDF